MDGTTALTDIKTDSDKATVSAAVADSNPTTSLDSIDTDAKIAPLAAKNELPTTPQISPDNNVSLKESKNVDVNVNSIQDSADETMMHVDDLPNTAISDTEQNERGLAEEGDSMQCDNLVSNNPTNPPQTDVTNSERESQSPANVSSDKIQSHAVEPMADGFAMASIPDNIAPAEVPVSSPDRESSMLVDSEHVKPTVDELSDNSNNADNSNDSENNSNDAENNSNDTENNSNDAENNSNNADNSNDVENNSNDAENNSNDAENNSNDVENNSNDADNNSNDAENNSNDADNNSNDAENNSNNAENNSNDAENNSNDVENNSNNAENNSNDAEKEPTTLSVVPPIPVDEDSCQSGTPSEGNTSSPQKKTRVTSSKLMLNR